MPSYSDILFGRIVLKNGLASHEVVSDCLHRKPAGESLGEVLVRRRILTPDQARKVQRAQALMQFIRAERTFARIVHQQRLVDLPTLRKCFQRQERERHRVRIGQLLTDKGLITPAQHEAVVDQQLMQIAEETARIEEEGLAGALAESVGYRPTDDLVRVTEAEDLDNSTMKRAVGPRGLFDAPSRDLIRRTLPVMKAASLEEEEVPERTLVMEPPRGLMKDPEPPLEASDLAGGDGLIGKTIASRYRILSKVGEGGMGTVYKAEHCLMEKVVALKVLHPSLVSSSKSLGQFRQEIRAASRFQHKNVVQIYDAGEGEGGIFYMAMEFAEGETLEETIAREGALSIDVCVHFFRQALRAVGEAHKKNIVHRDLKSGNLMVSRGKGGERLVKVMDFGIAKIAFDDESQEGGGLYRTQEGIVTGTPQYMSPEQASGERVDHRSDLYSLGVILFEMLTGQLPFKSNTPMGYLGKHIVEPPPRPSSVHAGVPPALEELVLRLLEKKPEDRFASAEDVLADLDVRCSGDGLRVSPLAAPSPPASPSPVGSTARPPALTVAVAPPTLPETEKAPSVAAAGPGRKTPWGLIVGLVLLLVLVVGGSTSLVLLSGEGAQPANDAEVDQRVATARKLYEAGDAGGAVKLLEELAPADQERPEVVELLAQSREAEANWGLAAQLAEQADDLAQQFRSGGSGEQAAREAIQRYEHALSLHADPAVRAKLEALRAELAAGGREDPNDTGRRGMARVLEANEAIQRGDLAAAEEKLREAKGLLPAGDDALVQLARYLDAAKELEAGKAARERGALAAAKQALTKAAELHPDAQVRGWIAQELKEIELELGKQQQRAAVTQQLERVDAAAAALDVGAARTLLDQAAKTAAELGLELPDLQRRRQVLDALGKIAGDLQAAEGAVAELEASSAGASPQDGRDLLTTLRTLRGRLSPVTEQDAALGKALGARLDALLARATKVSKAITAQHEQAKSRQLKRFERKLAKLRELPEVRETQGVVVGRLGAFYDLQERPSYGNGEASAEDRAWIDAQVEHYTARRRVWRDLTPEGALSAEMVQIPGGAWTPPGSEQPVELPRVYYLATHEVTCAEWARFMKAKGLDPPPNFPGPGDEPVRFLTRADAERYCRWRSKRADGSPRVVRFRLPTEVEWERGVRGAGGDPYPWGGDFDAWRKGYAAVGGRVGRVGSFRKDQTAWGLLDVVGNVSEITTSRADPKVLVLKGGSAVSARPDCRAGWRRELNPGDEAQAYVGLRLLAEER
jgi:serine/threonine-protein kinase